MGSSKPSRIRVGDNEIQVRVATSMNDLMHVFAVRSICLMEEHGLSVRVSMDGNDFQATHVLASYHDEPIGCGRLRWFSDFVQIDRTCVRDLYRSTRVLTKMVDFAFDHIAKKGFERALTHAAPTYARLWERFYGFQRVDGRPMLSYPGYSDEVVELERLVPRSESAITRRSEPRLFHSIEGNWGAASRAELDA